MLPTPPLSTLFPYTTLFRSLTPPTHSPLTWSPSVRSATDSPWPICTRSIPTDANPRHSQHGRSEEHTSELQSLAYLVCRLLLEKKQRRMSPIHHQRSTAEPL